MNVFALKSMSLHIPETTFCLVKTTATLGRSSKCDLIVKHDTVSRRHSEITVKQGTISLRDLNSRNGTFIDGKRILIGQVQLGQLIKFGSVTFSVKMIQERMDDPDSDLETAKCVNSDLSFVDISFAALSKAQRRVLNLVLQGLAEKQVASQLKLSVTTVHNHIQSIYRSFGVHSRSQLLVKALAKKV